MTVTLDFFSDSGLQNPVPGDVMEFGNTETKIVYLGSNEDSMKFEATSNPGTDPILVSVTHTVPERQDSTVYALNDQVRSASHNGYKYKAISIRGTGQTAATPPIWPTTVGQTVDDDSDPGIDGVTWECIAKTHEPEEVELSDDGITWQSPGADLNMGPTILSGVGNAEDVHIRVTDGTTKPSTLTELGLLLNDITEGAV